MDKTRAALDRTIADVLETIEQGDFYTDYDQSVSDLGILRQAAALSAEVSRLTQEVERLRSGRVKALEWVERVGVTGTFDAYTPIGHFIASVTDEGRGHWFIVGLTQSNYVGTTIDEAKAAAQTDFERRILSALSPEPSPGEAGEPVAYISRRVLEQFDVNGTEIVDADLFPKGTLSPTEEIPLYTHPKEAAPQEPTEAEVEAITDLIEERLCIIWAKAGAREQFSAEVREALKAARGAPGEAEAPAKPTDHASTSPGPVNCSIRKRHQGEDTPRTCERCTLGPCPFFHEDGSAKR